jgi:hypothetical protein
MNQLRMPVSNTTELAKVTAVINEVYRDICAKSDWWWLEKRTVINTTPNLIAGAANVLGVTAPASVSVSINSTAITFSAASTQSLLGFMFLVPGASNDPLAAYRIVSTSTASASHQLDAAYTNPTSTASSYRLYQDTYSLPADCGKLLYVKRFGYREALRLIGKNEMARLKIQDTTARSPQVATLLEFATVGDPTTQRQLVVHPYPDKMYRLEILYKQSLNTELATTTQPFIPDDYRQVLIYGTLARAYPIFLNDTERGKYYGELFNDVLALMAAQQKEYAHDQPGMAPKDDYRQQTRRRPRTNYTLGSYFDTLPNQP